MVANNLQTTMTLKMKDLLSLIKYIYYRLEAIPVSNGVIHDPDRGAMARIERSREFIYSGL